MSRPHLIESVGDALEEGVAGAVVRDALRVSREVFAHDDGWFRRCLEYLLLS